MELHVIGFGSIKAKMKKGPEAGQIKLVHQTMKLQIVAPGHIEMMEFAYPPEATEDEMRASIPTKTSEIADHWKKLEQEGFRWLPYAQKWAAPQET